MSSHAAAHDHPDDPDALSDEGMALDIAETVHAGKDGGPGAFFSVEDANALERLARWANANGYQKVPRHVHDALERAEGDAVPERVEVESTEWRIYNAGTGEVVEEHDDEGEARRRFARAHTLKGGPFELHSRAVGAWEVVA